MDFITECTDFTTNEGCLAAVQHHGFALQFVPEPMKTPEIILAAIQQHGYALRYLPYDKRTPELCLLAVKNHGLSLEYVPEHIKTPEICLAAVQQNGYALKYVPEHLQSGEIIQAAITQNPKAFRFAKKTITIHHGTPKQMPEKAYDTLEMGYDEETAIQDGELMVDFHYEFEHGRFYRKKTFEDIVLPSKKNPTTRNLITEYTIYQAIVVV